MMRNDINELKAAVLKSPDNIALRMSLAMRLLKNKEFDECEKNYQHVLKIDKDNIKAKQGLLELYFAKENYSAVIVIAEELAQRNIVSEKMMELQIKSLIRQNNIKDAQDIYNKLLDRNPFFFDEEIETVLSDEEEEDENDEFDSEFNEFRGIGEMHIPDFIDNPEMMMMPSLGTGFEDIVACEGLKSKLELLYGLDEISEEVKSSHRLKNCKSLLLYGPPGCGKSFSISRIPAEFSENIMALDLNKTSNQEHSVKNEYLLTFYYNMLHMAGPMTLYFDHFEDIMNYGDRSNLLFNNQFEMEMDKIYSQNLDLILIATSTQPWLINPAWLRYGRFDDTYFVAPPNDEERAQFFVQKLNLKDVNEAAALVEKSKHFSYADLTNCCEKVVYKNIVTNHLKAVIPPVKIEDIETAISESRSSILYWYVQFRELSSPAFKTTILYDTILSYTSKNNL
jgi:SpoVK/Ycf46/Vps4 family AAA+-type ATPase